jgi:hypothetical protein
MLACGALAIRAAAVRPSAVHLALAALATAVAALFRHDYGVYVGAGVLGTLVARDPRAMGATVRRLGMYAALTAAFLVRSALWVQLYEGIPTYVRRALATSEFETARTQLRLPPIELTSLFAADGLLMLTYYAFWALVIVAAVVCASRLMMGPTLTPEERATAAGLLVLAAMVNVFFLRANLSQRFGDAVVPVVLLGAWSIASASALPQRSVRLFAMTVPAALLIFALASAVAFGDVVKNLDTSGMSDSWEKVTRRFRSARADLAQLPPIDWGTKQAEGTLTAARYIAECTAPTDYVFIAGYAPEVPVFARRRFAAGQPTVSLSFYTSEIDQRRALERLASQSVPVVLGDAHDFEEAFVSDYPLLAEHVAARYREAGTIVAEDEPRFRVFVESSRPPRGTDPHFGLPCYR